MINDNVNDNNNINRPEEGLEEMRQQMALLKEKLDKEELVNERLLRETMHSKARSINHEAIWSGVCAIFVIVAMLTTFHPMGFSWGFCIGTTIFMLVCLGATLYQHRDINSRTMNGDLLTVVKTMRRLKKNYRDWLKFAFPAIILWMGWIGYEIYRMSEGNWKIVGATMGGCLIGATIGGILGLASHKKVIRTCDEIIKSIEEEE